MKSTALWLTNIMLLLIILALALILIRPDPLTARIHLLQPLSPSLVSIKGGPAMLAVDRSGEVPTNPVDQRSTDQPAIINLPATTLTGLIGQLDLHKEFLNRRRLLDSRRSRLKLDLERKSIKIAGYFSSIDLARLGRSRVELVKTYGSLNKIEERIDQWPCPNDADPPAEK